MCIFNIKTYFFNFQRIISSKVKKIETSSLLYFKDNKINIEDNPNKDKATNIEDANEYYAESNA